MAAAGGALALGRKAHDQIETFTIYTSTMNTPASSRGVPPGVVNLRAPHPMAAAATATPSPAVTARSCGSRDLRAIKAVHKPRFMIAAPKFSNWTAALNQSFDKGSL